MAALKEDLQASFTRLQQKDGLLAKGRLIDEHYAEDLWAFSQIGLVGMENIRVAEHRQVAWWRLQFNHIRSFRPQRSAARKVNTIGEPFNENGFFYTPELCQRGPGQVNWPQNQLTCFITSIPSPACTRC